jgi:serine/threonine protein kinase
MADVEERPAGHSGVLVSSPTVAESILVSHEWVSAGTVVGRYQIVEKLATGGMGVVFRAYDPELSRHVALKLVQQSSVDLERYANVEEYEQRLLREAQALARLSHPNVVAAFDVGKFAGALFIAMELIDGVSLRAWLSERSRSRAEIVHILLEAGRGLSAAHRAGVVHRDFKLANVMVSAQGRVQVVDFGLARTLGAVVPAERVVPAALREAPGGVPASGVSGELTRTGAIVGTAGYIAPEQFDGGASDERSDQFSYASSAFRALAGTSPYPAESIADYKAALERGARAAWPRSLPRAIRRVIDRGLMPRPEDRYPSLDALLDDLERAARPPRRVVLLVAIALGLSALAATLAVREHLSTRCQVDARSFEDVFGPEQRARVREAFGRSNNPRATDTFGLLSARLDEYRTRWQTAKQEACLAAHVRHEQSEQVLSLRNACFDSKLAQLQTTVRLLEHADAALVDRAPEAVDAVAQLRDCDDIAALVGESERLPDDPARRAQIQSLQREWDTMQAAFATGRWPELLAQARELASEAEAAAHKPIQARAMSQALIALERLARWDEVRELRPRTLELASEAKVSDVVAAQALRMLLSAVDGERMSEARAMLPLVDADVRLAGRPPTMMIRLLTYEAAILTADGEFRAAVERLGRALAECRQLGTDGLRSCLTPQRELGLLYSAQQDVASARRELEAAVALAKQAFGPRHPNVLNEYNNLAEIMLRGGDLDTAARALAEAKALAATLPENRQTANIWGNEAMLLAARGDLSAALPVFEESARRLAAAYGGSTVQASQGELYLGNCLVGLGRTSEALPHLERALELRRTLQGPPRSRAEAAIALAEALWTLPRRRAQSLELGRQALALYRGDGPRSADDAQRVERWLEERELPGLE